MRQLSLFLFLSFLGAAGFAQAFSVEPGPISSLTIAEGEGKEGKIYFKNLTNADLDLQWALKSNTLDSNWQVSIADYNLSWPGPWPGSTMTGIAALDSGNLHFSCAILTGDYGSGAISYHVWVPGDSSTMVEITFDVNGAVSVAPSYLSSFTISPNPTSGTLNLRAENRKLENGLVQVYDLSGKLYRELPVRREDAVDIQVEGLPEGAYLLRYVSKKGTVVRRFLKAK